ncbi:lipid A-modifier LpxR family protein [uncultured Tateyamaria sp.]|uniref:lipid A-modifier LpxR family protein n=1 Tax=uncultured Tateyamaria sp. TaxID=455651 RepID=UPI002633CFDA|nr:lipid A-modifier LpxR family protein [uncultured Tateyamaria sp.]
MFRLIAAALVACVCFSSLAEAQDRTRLGYGRLITNDFIGDGEDRWRTGSIQSSRIWGPAWTGTAPAGFGQLLELRLGAEILAPDDIRNVSASDRAYAGALSIGLHSHVQRGQVEIAVGGDLVFVGPQTGLDDFQDAFHDLLNVVRPSEAVRAAQIGNAITPTAVVEIGRNFTLSDSTVLRPFVEGRLGNETLGRVGFDLTFGQLGRGELLVRDAVTGHRYRAVEAEWSGYSFVLGADVAAVSDSEFLPEGGSVTLRDTRERLRAGLTWRSETGITAFYGLTYLGEEFEGQTEGQLVGSIRLRVPF